MARRTTYSVDLYRPLTIIEPFHRSQAKWRLIVGSNRSGKTLAAAVEFCRAVLGRDPYKKYPAEHGVALVIGLDSDHLGMLWRKLSLPGAFLVWRDGKQLQPLSPELVLEYLQNGQHAQNMTPAPQLIPESVVERIAWRDKARAIPHVVRLKNGWYIRFVTSQGRIQQGEHYDLVWIDEQISNEQFFWESARGLVEVDPTRKSYGIWSATSQKQNPLLWELAQKQGTTSSIDVYQITLADNPYIPDDEKKRFAEMLPEVERQVRIEGMWALEAWRIYPNFEPQGKHGCDPFEIPETWSRYLALDPGTVNCATVFAAVPPDQKNIYVYDELLLHNVDARTWAQQIATRTDAKQFEAWIIDRRAGRVRSIGQSLQVAQLYFQAADGYGIRPRMYGPLAGWMPGEDNTDLRRERLRQVFWATDQEDTAIPGIKLFKGRTPNLVQQLRTVQFDSKKEDRRIQGTFDLVDALEYLVAYQPTYIERSTVSQPSKRIVDIYRELRRRPNWIPIFR